MVNVWGVGYRLVDGEVPERAAAATAAALAAPPLPGPGEPVDALAHPGAETDSREVAS